MISFKDLSWPLKVAVIAAWVYGVAFLFSFIIGFIEGFLGAV